MALSNKHNTSSQLSYSNSESPEKKNGNDH